MKIRAERFVLVNMLGIGFFGLIGALIILDIPEANRDLLNITIGILGTSYLNALSFYFKTYSHSGGE